MRCYCAGTRQVARRLTRFYEAALRPAGVNPPQFELMSNLQARPGASQAELSSAMVVDQTTLSRNLKLLVAQGWVSCGTSSKDARRAEYQLTADGGKVLLVAMPRWERATARIRQVLGEHADKVFSTLVELGEAAETAGDGSPRP